MARAPRSDADPGEALGTDAVEAVIDRFFAAIAAGERATIAELHADDIVVWHGATDHVADKATALAILDRLLLAPDVTMSFECLEQVAVDDRVCAAATSSPSACRATIRSSCPSPSSSPSATVGSTASTSTSMPKGTDRLIQLIPPGRSRTTA